MIERPLRLRWLATHWVRLAGGVVTCAAAAATAHGLYEVAHAAGVPPTIAVLYPAITDGLALVAYAATTRLSGWSAAYAWLVVVLAAGLSGAGQAAHLAGVSDEVTWGLRAGVGAWPALAAAITAHLLWLLVDRPAVELRFDTALAEVTAPPAPLPDLPPGPPNPPTGDRAAAHPTSTSHLEVEVVDLPVSDLPVEVEVDLPADLPVAEETWEQLAWSLLEEDAGRSRLMEVLGISEYHARRVREAGISREEAWERITRARENGGRSSPG